MGFAGAGCIGLGGMLIQFLLIITIAAIMYGGGEQAARLMHRFGRRLAGARGEHSMILAAQAIRGVALGVGSVLVMGLAVNLLWPTLRRRWVASGK